MHAYILEAELNPLLLLHIAKLVRNYEGVQSILVNMNAYMYACMYACIYSRGCVEPISNTVTYPCETMKVTTQFM